MNLRKNLDTTPWVGAASTITPIGAFLYERGLLEADCGQRPVGPIGSNLH